MLLNFLWTITFVITGSFYFDYQKEKINLTAAIKKSVISSQEDLLIKLTLRNQTNKQLLIHKHISFGYLSMCFDDDYCFEAEKKVNHQFKKMKELANIDRIPGFDSSGVAWDDMYDTLNVGQSFLQNFSVKGYYSFDKGQYRVRFAFQIPVKNNLQFKIVYSNWIYFEVKAKHINFHF